ncbi:MAG: alpha-N-acetylglucosaminidase TIM-barrel domain-containing protein [Mycobacteriales bacterium]
MTASWSDAVRSLAERIGGTPLAGALRVGALPAGTAARTYRYRCADGVLHVDATEANAASVALHHYLQTACARQVCWDTPLPLDLPLALPDAAERTSRARSTDSYYLNFCTFSYTTAYWGWERWEREIDWMALHGITMPLAATGHEAVLLRVYVELGLTDEEARAFIGGPGYLPFHFMGCVENFGRTLPTSWLEPHRVLGASIIEREREFGMRPVLPGFTGHVPAQLDLGMTTTRDWAGITTHALDPSEPAFADITRRIIAAQRELFGTDSLYAVDPFIEMPPDSFGPDELNRYSGQLFAALRSADPRARWILQSWPFTFNADYWTKERVDAFLDGVPDDGMTVLDLFAEHTPAWTREGGLRGKPWQWCLLHNFGGVTPMFGNLDGLAAGVEAAFSSPDPPVGVGLTMEGAGTNPVVYELATALAWGPVGNVGEWLRGFVARRYEADLPDAQSAWEILRETVYHQSDARPARSALQQIPTPAGPREAAPPEYDPIRIRQAGRLLLQAARATGVLDGPMGSDLIAVTTVLAGHSINRICAAVAAAYDDRDRDRFEGAARMLLLAFNDLDSILASRPEWRFGSFRDHALAWAMAPADRSILLDNSRRIVTMWDYTPFDQLTDYAARIWSGMVDNYYWPRWSIWLDELRKSLDSGADVDPDRLRSRLADRAEQFIRVEYAARRPPADLEAELIRLAARYGETSL